MFEKFSKEALNVIELASSLSHEKGLRTIGTEGLLYALFNSVDSACRYIFEEYDVTEEDIKGLLNEYIIIRGSDDTYNLKFQSVIKTASQIASDQGVAEVLEEHIFFGALLVKDTIFISMISDLGIELRDILDDIRSIFDLSETEDFEYTTNLTKKAKDDELDKFIGRTNYLNRMIQILNRKGKNNPLLIGSAGVGKSALVEGLAKYYVDNKIDTEILSLNVGSLLSNTKYRGDFEARLDKLTNMILKKKNVILFIDEIHTIMGAGSSEGALDAANILKPFLARSSFKVIGATTLEEYRKSILTDKALNRRFQSIFVSEPSIEETKDILYGIRRDYEKFHNVKVSNDSINYIIDSSCKKISNRQFPDKAIDCLDEALSLAKMNYNKVLTNKIIDTAIMQINGLNKPNISPLSFYKELNPMYLDYALGIERKILGSVSFSLDDYNFNCLKTEIKSSLGITDEMFLELDLSAYKEAHSISSLIGSPKGYVGYDEGGILSEHISSYPLSVVVLSNISSCCTDIIKLFDTIESKGIFYDKKGNLVNCNNLILIYKEKNNTNNSLGFINSSDAITSKRQYTIINKKESIEDNLYKKFFKEKGYDITYVESDFLSNKELYLTYFLDIVENYDKGNYKLDLKDSELCISLI